MLDRIIEEGSEEGFVRGEMFNIQDSKKNVEFIESVDDADIDVNNIEQRERVLASYVQKDAKAYVEFTVTGYTAKKENGSSLKLLSVGLLNDGTSGYNFESPSKERRMQ